MEFSVWKTACRFCGKLADKDECKECDEHFKVYGHYPNHVSHYQVPGQPRIMRDIAVNVESSFNLWSCEMETFLFSSCSDATEGYCEVLKFHASSNCG
jgi:hypothetical protein